MTYLLSALWSHGLVRAIDDVYILVLGSVCSVGLLLWLVSTAPVLVLTNHQRQGQRFYIAILFINRPIEMAITV